MTSTDNQHDAVITVKDGAVDVSVVCRAPLESPCHYDWDCECEHYSGVGVSADGFPWHDVEVYAQDDSIVLDRHTGTYDDTSCNYANWVQAEDPLTAHSGTSRFTIPISFTWEGDDYSWTQVPQEA